MIKKDELRYRFHAPNPGWGGDSLAASLSTGFTFLPIGAAAGYGAFLLQGRWGAGLLWFVALVLIVSGLAAFAKATLGSLLWLLATASRRRKHRMALAERGWPRVWLTPSLTAFSAQAWERLPEYQAFVASPIASHAHGIRPLQLYAALCLAEAALHCAPLGEDCVEAAAAKILAHGIEAKCVHHSV